MKCAVCGRELRTEASRIRGIGPVCLHRQKGDLAPDSEDYDEIPGQMSLFDLDYAEGSEAFDKGAFTREASAAFMRKLKSHLDIGEAAETKLLAMVGPIVEYAILISEQ